MSKMKYNPLTGEMDTVDVCVTSEDITIDAESPLAESLDLGMWPEYWKDPDGNPIIPKGTDLETVLLELFTATKSIPISWRMSDVICDYVPSNIEYTPIIEAHGGKWTLVSDISANVLNARLIAKLNAPYGYFKSLDGEWRSEQLVVEIPLTFTKTITYKKDGSTCTRNPGNWRNEPWYGEQSFCAGSAISEENTFNFNIPSGTFYDEVYASTNKKRIVPSYSTSLILQEGNWAKTFITTKKIHCSHYYFWGIFDLGMENILLNDSDFSHFDKDFLHKVRINQDGDTYITLPDSIDMHFIIPSDKVLVIAIPRVETNDNKQYIPEFNLPEGLRDGCSLVEYICPDGTIVNYSWIMIHNTTDNAVGLDITLVKE